MQKILKTATEQRHGASSCAAPTGSVRVRPGLAWLGRLAGRGTAQHGCIKVSQYLIKYLASERVMLCSGATPRSESAGDGRGHGQGKRGGGWVGERGGMGVRSHANHVIDRIATY